MKVHLEDVKKIQLLPGEILVIRYNTARSVASNEVKYFQSKFAELFPDNKVLFIADTMEIDKIIKTTED